MRHPGASGGTPRSYGAPATQLDPSQRESLAAAHYDRAREHLARAEYHEAITCLSEAVRYQPGKDRYHRLLGQTLLKNPRWKKRAEEQFCLAIEANPLDKDSLLELARIYESTRLHARAVSSYRRVLAIDAGDETAREGLAALERGPTLAAPTLGRLRRLAQAVLRRLGLRRPPA